MHTDNHEVILAVVDSGFADDVMDVARENGARGGTVLNARGVINERAADFFGITLHADKEILMIVVEKAIRNQILNAVYKKLDMGQKARGIAFCLPITDVVGLVQHESKEKKTEE